MSGIRCNIFKNCADHGDGRLMQVPESLEQFLKQAGDKLKIKAERAYTETGGLVDDIVLVRDDDKIFISSGEPFFKYDSSHVSTYKIAVLGSGGVGKSCLSMRYVRSTFVDIYDPTIEDAFRHQTVVDGHTCILDILDTAGQEDMKMLRRQWVEDRDGFLLVFSIADRTTFDDMEHFYDLVEEVKEDKLPEIPLVVVGNKADLVDRRQVQTKDGQDLANNYKASYVETSAKTGDGVNEAFETLIRNFIKLSPEAKNGKDARVKKKSICVLL